MTTNTFTIKSYSKSELALLNFPGSDPHVALNRLIVEYLGES